MKRRLSDWTDTLAALGFSHKRRSDKGVGASRRRLRVESLEPRLLLRVPLYWDPTHTLSTGGGGSGTWDNTTANWYNPGTETDTTWVSTDTADFGGPSGTVTVAAAVTAGEISFSTGGYTVQLATSGSPSLATGAAAVGSGISDTISAALGGSSGLTLIGPGTLWLTGSNTYTGGTTLDSGALIVTSDAGLGTAPGSPATNITFVGSATLELDQNSSLTLNANRGIAIDSGATATLDVYEIINKFTATYAGAISGSGSLVVTGGGTLNLTGTSTYTGSTSIDAGILEINSDAALGADPSSATPGAITFNGNGDLAFTAAMTLNTNRGVTIDSGDVGTLDTLGHSVSYGGIISGAGSLAAISSSGAGTLSLTGSNTYSGGTSINSGNLYITADASLGTAPFSPATNITFAGSSTLQLANYTTINPNRGITIDSGATATLNNGGYAVSYAGVIGGGGGLTAAGSGTLILSGDSTYTGATAVQAGTLELMGTNNLPTATSLTLGVGSEGGTLDLGGPIGQSLTGLSTAGSNPSADIVTSAPFRSASLTLTNSATDTFQGTIDELGALTMNGSGVLVLSGNNQGVQGNNNIPGLLELAIDSGTVRLGSANALGNRTVNASGGTLDLCGQTVNSTGAFAVFNGTITNSSSTAATLPCGFYDTTTSFTVSGIGNITFSGLPAASGAFTKTGANTLTLTGPLASSGDTIGASFGSTTVNQGALVIDTSQPDTLGALTVANGATLSLGGAVTADATTVTFNSGSTLVATMTAIGSSQIIASNTVSVGGALLSLTNGGVSGTYGSLYVPIETPSAISGKFSGFPEGQALTVGGVHFFITYLYNAATGTFGNGDDLAISSSLVSALPVAAAPGVLQPATTSVTNQVVRDATEHLETSTTAKVVTQFQFPTLTSGNFSSVGSPWPTGGYTVSYSSENTSVATVNATTGLVTFTQADTVPTTCEIVMSISGGGTNNSKFQTNIAILLTGEVSGGATTTLVNQYTPTPFSAASNLLVLYNANLASSVDLLDNYLANRPGVSGANTLGITGIPTPSFADNYGNDDINGSAETAILAQLNNWIASNETLVDGVETGLATTIRYVELLAGLPTQGAYGWASIPNDIYNDSNWGGNFNSSEPWSDYQGSDQFTVAEYGHPLVSVLNMGDNTVTVTGQTSNYWGDYAVETNALAGGVQQYGDVSTTTFSSVPFDYAYNGVSYQLTDDTFVQTANGDNQNPLFSMSFWANPFSAVDILYDQRAYDANGDAAPSWITAAGYTEVMSAPNTPVTVTNSSGHTFLIFQLDPPGGELTFGPNDGVGGSNPSEMYSVVVAQNSGNLSNIDSASPNSYQLEFASLAAGAPQYGDQTTTTFTSVPSQFTVEGTSEATAGDTFIQMANADNQNPSFAMTFSSTPAVYVDILYDNAAYAENGDTLPSWMAGYSKALNSQGQPTTVTNSAGHTFTLWQPFSLSTGPVTLGPNQGYGGSDMYSVVLLYNGPNIYPTAVVALTTYEQGLAVTNDNPATVYPVQNSDFNADGYPYGDQTWSFASPGQFADSTYIQTANADNQNTAFSMSFTVGSATRVDILYDDAISDPPSWLTTGFAKLIESGEPVTLTNSNGHTFTVYQSNAIYQPHGAVNLGANGGSSSSEMYCVLLVPPNAPILTLTNLTPTDSDDSGAYHLQIADFGAPAESQYVDQPGIYFTSIPSSYTAAFDGLSAQSEYVDNTYIQTAQADNANPNFSLSFTLDNEAIPGFGSDITAWGLDFEYQSAAVSVDILYDSALTPPGWLTGSFTETTQTVTNSAGYTFNIWQSNPAYGPDSPITLGPNDGNSGSEMYSVLLVSPFNQTDAYLAKEVAAANANGKAGLGSDGVTINGALAGVDGATYILDDTGGPDFGANGYNTAITAMDPSADIYLQSNAAGPNVDVVTETPNLTGIGNVAAYGSNGEHSLQTAMNTPLWPEEIAFAAGNNGWWAGMSVESYDGVYNCDFQANPSTFFAPTAFEYDTSDAPYANTPIVFVGTTQEPGGLGVEDANYMAAWARGLTSLESAWAGMRRASAIAITDIQLEQNAPIVAPAAPTLQSPTVISSNEIELNWTPSSTQPIPFTVNGYGIWRAPDNNGSPGMYTLLGTVGASTTTYTDTGLSAGTKYWYKIEAYFLSPYETSNIADISVYTNQTSAKTPVAPSSLVAYWRLDEGTGATAYDTATGGHYVDTGTTTGSPTWLTGSSSHIGAAMQFNGSSQYVSVANSSDLDMGGSQITLVAWAKSGATNWSSSDDIISYGAYSLGGVAGSTSVEFRLNLGGTWDTLSFAPSGSVTGWNQYAGSYDGSTMRLYDDGSLVASKAASGTIGAVSGSLYMAYNGASGYLNGSLDEVRIYNAKLTDAAIAALYAEPNLNVASLTTTGSLSSSAYHVQSFDFGAGGVNQYGDISGGFSSPAQFFGSTFIQTANADNENASFSMSFSLNTASTVYILFDNAIPNPPAWLTSEFTSTGKTIINSAGHTFTIYEAVYLPGETVSLGANDGNVNSEMYSVLFAPLTWDITDNEVL